MPVLISSSTSRDMIQFMSIPAALEAGPSQKSYEEVRIDDYLLAYKTTGKPPLPCPQEPVLAHERAARRLPPLFQPTVLPAHSTSEVSTGNNDSLPEWQLFAETRSSSGPGSLTMDKLQSITAAEQYAGLSFEELRCHAYRAGRVTPPPHILSGTTSIASSSTLQSNGIQWGGDTNETLLSISSKPDFALHSFEELRLASMKAHGRDVTSKEILGTGIPGLSLGTSSSTITNSPFSASPSPSGFGSVSNPTAPAIPTTGAPGGSFTFSAAIRF
ncbi:hypothetical protein J3R30DRAFT_3370995 [Lentinula aciculospora]|uniref:Uncharacterized protein n=1 Tax=Lentinula aciculospora TaxID=153920 RepID=A0A9W9ADM9_9AGAR|nr:hypothetical protein J3R30DRAFT_3370995 [Lentinula aciculospora]